MFPRVPQIIKKFGTIILTTFCVIMTLVSITLLILIDEKRPAIIILAVALLFDVVWFLLHKFFVSKL